MQFNKILSDENGYKTIYLEDSARHVVVGPLILVFTGFSASPGSSARSSYSLTLKWNEACSSFVKILAKTTVLKNFQIKNENEKEFCFIVDDYRTYLSDQHMTCSVETRRCPRFLFEENGGCSQALYFLKGYILGCGLDVRVDSEGKGTVYVKASSKSFCESLINLFKFCGMWAERVSDGFSEIVITGDRAVEEDGVIVRKADDGYVAKLMSWILVWDDFNDVDFKTEPVTKVFEIESLSYHEGYEIDNSLSTDDINTIPSSDKSVRYDGWPHFIDIVPPKDLSVWTNDDSGLFRKVRCVDLETGNLSEVFTNYNFYFVNSYERRIPDIPNFRLYRTFGKYHVIQEDNWCVDAGHHIIRWKAERLDRTTGKVEATTNGSSILEIVKRSIEAPIADIPTVHAADYSYEYEDGKRFIGGGEEGKVRDEYITGFSLPKRTEESIDPRQFFPYEIDAWTVPSAFIESSVYSSEGGGSTPGKYSSIIESVSIADASYQEWKGREIIRSKYITDFFVFNTENGVIDVWMKEDEDDYMTIDFIPHLKKESTNLPLDLSILGSKSQFILSGGDVGVQCDIHKIGFRILSLGNDEDRRSSVSRNIELYVSEKGSDDVEFYAAPSEDTMVFSGKFEFGLGDNYVKLERPIEYTGKALTVTMIDRTEDEEQLIDAVFESRSSISSSITSYIKEKGKKPFILLGVHVHGEGEADMRECFVGEACTSVLKNDMTSASPMVPVFMSSNMSVVQTILGPDEIVKSGIVKYVSFFSTTSGYENIRNMAIYMKMVDRKSPYESSRGWIPFSLQDLVGSYSNIILSNGWNRFDFSFPMMYERATEGGTEKSLVLTVVAQSWTSDVQTMYNVSPDPTNDRFLSYSSNGCETLIYGANATSEDTARMSIGRIGSDGSTDATVFGYHQKPCLVLGIV